MPCQINLGYWLAAMVQSPLKSQPAVVKVLCVCIWAVVLEVTLPTFPPSTPLAVPLVVVSQKLLEYVFERSSSPTNPPTSVLPLPPVMCPVE